MFLKGAVQLKKGPTRFQRFGSPWVFSNELAKIDKTLAPGSWVSLEGHDGQALGYGYFNPYSLIAFRIFERAAFKSEEQARAVFFRRLDAALLLRQRAYGAEMAKGEIGKHSYRLAFGESDGVPGLVVDLFEASGATGAMAVIQCHAAGADQFIEWTRQWLSERMSIHCGMIRNDLDVRRKENVELYARGWGILPASTFALEGGVRFFVDPQKGQKTGYFYDHRDNRDVFARRASSLEGQALDCFSYVGSWGLQIIKRNSKLTLTAVDISASALELLKHNAAENGLSDRVEAIQADFFKDKKALGDRTFAAVVSDPPALTSSPKQAAEGKRAHEVCFYAGLNHMAPGGIAALASCSYHLGWDDFMICVSKAGLGRNRQLKISHIGSQSADHPILSTLPETRYLKCVIVEMLS